VRHVNAMEKSGRPCSSSSARAPGQTNFQLDCAFARAENSKAAFRCCCAYVRSILRACVRPTHSDEIVECENVSKGGVCFHRLQQYPLDPLIEVAAPFSPAPLFVPAQIKRVEPLSGGLVFRYGVEYRKFSSTEPYSQSS
jgi:hypothetical protein